jgi:hypothetical protein
MPGFNRESMPTLLSCAPYLDIVGVELDRLVRICDCKAICFNFQVGLRN